MLFNGCAAKKSQIDYRLPPINLPEPEVYVLDTTKIPKIDPPNFIFLIQNKDGSFRLAKDNEEPTHAALDKQELLKIEAMLVVKDMYKDISKEQELLINIERIKYKKVSEMLQLEREMRNMERDLRLEIERIYNKERRDHIIDNLINRGVLFLFCLGCVAIAAL